MTYVIENQSVYYITVKVSEVRIRDDLRWILVYC